ncbi:Alpha/Beta hydrolase protein [Chytriomyces sp. MP71]|nr:Alpha/Beta hydrolase protein [Chytriomyces sp. MP71]
MVMRRNCGRSVCQSMPSDNLANILSASLHYEAVALHLSKTVDALDLIVIGGFPTEKHTVRCNDGTLLTIHRILISNAQQREAARPVLLWPGFGGSSNCFICQPHKRDNLAFILADAGFDIWLGNPRNVVYTTFSNEASRPALQFSMDDIIELDIPSVVDYILQSTRKEKLAYIGVSQGTTALFGALALHDTLNTKISVAIAIAPTLKPKRTAVPEYITRGYRLLRGFLPNELFLYVTSISRASLHPKILARFVALFTYIGFKWDASRLGCRARQLSILSHIFNGTSKQMVEVSVGRRANYIANYIENFPWWI